jgi:hypothetical protein
MKRRRIFFTMPLTVKVWEAMMPITRRSFFFAALQFVVITRYYVSLRLANKETTTHAKHHPAEDFWLNNCY